MSRAMRRWRMVVLSLLACLVLAGCASRDTSTDDDASCRARSAQGSPEYVACRKDRDVQRANFNARIDRRQRDLGEYMLNNPSKP